MIFGGGLIKIRLSGLEKLQRANQQILEAVDTKIGMHEAVKQATIMLQRYAIGITHVRTGTLKRSHTMDFGAGGVQSYRFGIPIVDKAVGRIYIDPNAVNPVTKERPSEYGLVEHAKGGSHAFYKRTVEEAGPTAQKAAIGIIQGMLPRSHTKQFIGRIRIPSSV